MDSICAFDLTVITRCVDRTWRIVAHWSPGAGCRSTKPHAHAHASRPSRGTQHQAKAALGCPEAAVRQREVVADCSRSGTTAFDPLRPYAIFRSSDRSTSVTSRSLRSTAASVPRDSGRSRRPFARPRLTGSFPRFGRELSTQGGHSASPRRTLLTAASSVQDCGGVLHFDRSASGPGTGARQGGVQK